CFWGFCFQEKTQAAKSKRPEQNFRQAFYRQDLVRRLIIFKRKKRMHLKRRIRFALCLPAIGLHTAFFIFY
ncbi:MAG: hypothetical protein ACLS5X_08155, partial [Eubacterium sp.]